MGPTYYSQMKYPAKKTLMEKLINCEVECKRNGNNLNLQIISSYIMKDLFESSSHEILKSQTSYEVITTGQLTIEELYTVYHHAMSAMILGLNQQESANGIQPTKDLQPIPLAHLRPDLQPIVDYFGN